MRNLYTLTLSVLLIAIPLSLSAQLPWPATSPAPDSYGYTWKTNSDPTGPAYIWEDISAIGTEITGLGDDGNSGPIRMGIDFPYYWYTRNEVWVADNGFMAFSNTPIGSGANGFPPTPTPSDPNDVIAPFMADMNPTGAGNPHKVYYYTDSVNNRFIVSWENMPYWVPPNVDPNQWAGSNSFQVILDASDSTITFNYKSLVGNWAPPYDDDPYPFVVGIENVSGTFGFMPPALPATNPFAQRPVDNSSIRFYPPSSASPVTDVAVSNVQNDEIQAFFVPWEQPPATTNPDFKLYAGVTNVGNTDIIAPVPVIAQVRDNNQLLFYQARDTAINGLMAGETQYFQFNIPFYPPTAGSYTYVVTTENPALYGDQNATNDQRINEAVVVDTAQTEVTFGYASGDINNLNQANGGSIIAWNGNEGKSGAGAFYDSYGYPVSITALEYFVGTGAQLPNSEAFLAQIHGVDTTTGSVPGPLLYSDTILNGQVPQFPIGPTTQWVRVDLDSPIVIQDDGFYVSWIQRSDSSNLFTEASPAALPISRRSFEILGGGWSIWRSNSTDELWIRAIVNIEDAQISTSVAEELEDITALSVYPNPSTGVFTVHAELAEPQPVELKVFDITGRKVFRQRVAASTSWDQTIDLSQMESGVYLMQVISPSGATTTRLIKQ